MFWQCANFVQTLAIVFETGGAIFPIIVAIRQNILATKKTYAT
jgi:hypothetical protein